MRAQKFSDQAKPGIVYDCGNAVANQLHYIGCMILQFVYPTAASLKRLLAKWLVNQVKLLRAFSTADGTQTH